jgi:hypothetical protein
MMNDLPLRQAWTSIYGTAECTATQASIEIPQSIFGEFGAFLLSQYV